MRNYHLVSLAIGLMSCGMSSSKNHETRSEKWQYEYKQNGCSTGPISGEGKDLQCKALLDNERNHFCAKDIRQDAYKALCGATPKDAGNSN
jgi:hypothetical protein